MSDEVERLREQQTQLRPPHSEPRNEAALMPSTTLVFRNGKTQQVLNYAIVGQTLWVFNEQREMKIPLSELDVPATQALNEEHGVSFQIPPGRPIGSGRGEKGEQSMRHRHSLAEPHHTKA